MRTDRARAVPAASDLPPGTWPWLHEVARWIGRWWFRPFFRVRWHCRESIPASGPVVLVSNHSTLVEGPLLFGMLGRHAVFLVKRELFRGPVGWGLLRIGQLPVRRGTPDRAPLLAALDVLRAGGLIAVFPEGTRGTGEVRAAHHGAAWLARSTGAAVLPVVCRGTHRPDRSRRRWRPRVDVLVGETLSVPAGGGRAGLTAATETIRAALAGMVRELDEVRSNTT
jgi:1-acyl-sn-glycerol-3-phosphate acyltransferase